MCSDQKRMYAVLPYSPVNSHETGSLPGSGNRLAARNPRQSCCLYLPNPHKCWVRGVYVSMAFWKHRCWRLRFRSPSLPSPMFAHFNILGLCPFLLVTCLSLLQILSLEQHTEFCGTVVPQVFKTLPHVVLTPNHNITSLLLHYCNFATIVDCNINVYMQSICHVTPVKGLLNPPRVSIMSHRLRTSVVKVAKKRKQVIP